MLRYIVYFKEIIEIDFDIIFSTDIDIDIKTMKTFKKYIDYFEEQDEQIYYHSNILMRNVSWTNNKYNIPAYGCCICSKKQFLDNFYVEFLHKIKQ